MLLRLGLLGLLFVWADGLLLVSKHVVVFDAGGDVDSTVGCCCGSGGDVSAGSKLLLDAFSYNMKLHSSKIL